MAKCANATTPQVYIQVIEFQINIPNIYALISSKNYTSEWHDKWPLGDGTPVQTWELDFFKVHFNKSEKYELWAALQSRAELLQTLEAREEP